MPEIKKVRKTRGLFLSKRSIYKLRETGDLERYLAKSEFNLNFHIERKEMHEDGIYFSQEYWEIERPPEDTRPSTATEINSITNMQGQINPSWLNAINELRGILTPAQLEQLLIESKEASKKEEQKPKPPKPPVNNLKFFKDLVLDD